jgi:hypothetical protein
MKLKEPKMKTFVVTVDFESQQFEIEAENIEQAEKKVDLLYEEGQVYAEGYLIGHIEEGE